MGFKTNKVMFRPLKTKTKMDIHIVKTKTEKL